MASVDIVALHNESPCTLKRVAVPPPAYEGSGYERSQGNETAAPVFCAAFGFRLLPSVNCKCEFGF